MPGWARLSLSVESRLSIELRASVFIWEAPFLSRDPTVPSPTFGGPWEADEGAGDADHRRRPRRGKGRARDSRTRAWAGRLARVLRRGAPGDQREAGAKMDAGARREIERSRSGRTYHAASSHFRRIR